MTTMRALACCASLLACSGGTTSGPGVSGDGGLSAGGGDGGVAANPSGAAAPLTAVEGGLTGTWIEQRVIDGRRNVMVFTSDRKGCYYHRYETGERTNFVGITTWRIEETPTPATGTKDNVVGFPIVYSTDKGNSHRSDLYSPEVREIWGSGIVSSGGQLVQTGTALDCDRNGTK